MKMSLREFATLVGVSVSSVKRWEAGTAEPSEAQREAVFSTLSSGERYQQNAAGLHPGWWLRLARHAQGVSIRRAGELTGVSPSAWQRFETGQSKLGLQQAQRLTFALGEPALGAPRLGADLADQPHACGMAILSSLLGHSRLEPSEAACHELAALAQALMQIGDHDLCGQAYHLAYTLGKRANLDQDTVMRWKLSSLWVGFPSIKAPRFASARLSWLENKLAQVSPEVKSDYGIVRAMFLDWTGYPSLAKEMLERTHGRPEHEELGNLMLGWFEAKYGDPLAAIRRVEPSFEADLASSRFLARKVAFEASLQLNDLGAAREHFAVLEEIRQCNGHWSPDLTSRRKRLAE